MKTFQDWLTDGRRTGLLRLLKDDELQMMSVAYLGGQEESEKELKRCKLALRRIFHECPDNYFAAIAETGLYGEQTMEPCGVSNDK